MDFCCMTGSKSTRKNCGRCYKTKRVDRSTQTFICRIHQATQITPEKERIRGNNVCTERWEALNARNLRMVKQTDILASQGARHCVCSCNHVISCAHSTPNCSITSWIEEAYDTPKRNFPLTPEADQAVTNWIEKVRGWNWPRNQVDINDHYSPDSYAEYSIFADWNWSLSQDEDIDDSHYGFDFYSEGSSLADGIIPPPNTAVDTSSSAGYASSIYGTSNSSLESEESVPLL